MRIFVNNCDSYVGNTLCSDLRRIGDVTNQLFGTLLGGRGAQVPPSIQRVVSRTDSQQLLKTITSCSAIIYDLHDQDLEELEFVLKGLKLATFVRPTTFVLVSSLNVWAKTKKIYEVIPAEEGEEDAEPVQTLVPFKDVDFRKRIPGPKYMDWKTMETLVLALNSKENLRSFVVGAGVLYGNGDATFHDVFKASWQSLTDKLRVIGGKNVIPTVHVRDLARLVKHVITEPQSAEHEYIVATDRGNRTQAEIIEGIVSTVSDRTTKIDVLPLEEALLVDDADLFTLDLLITPSSLMNSIHWWCEEGLNGNNLEMVAQEFCKWRKLTPIKILANAPPGAGLTPLIKRMASYYRIPIINVDEEVELWLKNKEPVEETEDGEGGGDNEHYNNVKAKWEEAKGMGVHLEGSLLSGIVSERLQSNVCRFRGYILDCYPDTFENTEHLFMKVEPTEEEEAEGKKSVNTSILPDYIMNLESDIAKCQQRALKDGQIDEAEFQRRASLYHKNFYPEDGSPTVTSFFEETCQKEVLRLSIDELSGENEVELLFDAFRVHLEKVMNGKPFNYLETEQKNTELLAKQTKVAEAEQICEEKQREKQEQQILQERQKEQAEKNKQKEKQLIAQEKQLLEQHSLPLRQYMATHVVPTLTDGLLEVCKVMPDDPVDYLAEYLFAHAQEIPAAPDL